MYYINNINYLNVLNVYISHKNLKEPSCKMGGSAIQSSDTLRIVSSPKKLPFSLPFSTLQQFLRPGLRLWPVAPCKRANRRRQRAAPILRFPLGNVSILMDTKQNNCISSCKCKRQKVQWTSVIIRVKQVSSKYSMTVHITFLVILIRYRTQLICDYL